MIIGITGWIASGKDTVGDYLVEKGFSRFSFSDYLREQLKREGVELTRDNLRVKGNLMRKELGTDFIAKKAIEFMNDNDNKNWVLLSIRLLSEVDYLRKHCDFKLWNIEVPDNIRYKRALARAKVGEENISFEDFIEKDSVEKQNHNNSQEVDRVIEVADITIENSGTLSELYQKVDKTVSQL